MLAFWLTNFKDLFFQVSFVRHFDVQMRGHFLKFIFAETMGEENSLLLLLKAPYEFLAPAPYALATTLNYFLP